MQHVSSSLLCPDLNDLTHLFVWVDANDSLPAMSARAVTCDIAPLHATRIQSI